MIEVGFLLSTRDGKAAGNAIVTDVYRHKIKGPMVAFETDFGKIGCLPIGEIPRFFHVEPECFMPVRHWRELRIATILRQKDRTYEDDEDTSYS